LAGASAAAVQISDLFFFPYGWWTNANAAMVDCDQPTAGFDRVLGTDVTVGGRSTGFLTEVRVRVVEEDDLRGIDPELRSFVHVNTPEEYADVLARLRLPR